MAMNNFRDLIERLTENLNAVEEVLSDSNEHYIEDGKRFVHGLVLNSGGEAVQILIRFKNDSRLPITLEPGQAVSIQNLPIRSLQNLNSSQNPDIYAYLATSETALGSPKLEVTGAPATQVVSFSNISQPVNITNEPTPSFINVNNGYVQWFEGTLTTNSVILEVAPNVSFNNAWDTVLTSSLTVINVASLSGTSPTVQFSLYAPIGSIQSGTNSYIASASSNLIEYNNYYWAPLPNASTSSITTAGVYTLSTATPLPGIMVYATVGGTSPSISINAVLTVSVV